MEEEHRIMNLILENINTIMWESFMIKSKGFSDEDGKKIMQELEKWAKI